MIKNKKIAMGLAAFSLFTVINGGSIALANDVEPVVESENTVITNRAMELFALAYVTADELNIRSGPGTNYTAIDSLSRGESLFAGKYENGWYHVKYYENNKEKTGWVSAEFIMFHPD